MHNQAVVRAMLSLDLERRTPLLQMTPDELIRTYMTPLTLGVFLSCFFYGIFVAYLYFTQFKPDTWLNRGVVILLLCFTTADTVAGAVRIFRMTVVHPNDLPYILDVTKRPEDWLCTVMLLITVLTAQLFMSYRIVTFARHMSAWNQTPEGAKRGRRRVWVLGGVLGVGWLACVGACAANMAVFYQVTNYMQLLLPTQRLARLFRGTSLIMPCVLCIMDLMVAVIMTMQYRKARTGFGVSDHILGTLMNVIIRNGAMMAGIMLTQLLVTLFKVLWGNFMPLFYGKLHALTVLAILTEPRVAKAEYFKSQESGGPTIAAGAGGASSEGPVETPYMDFTRPSQYGIGGSKGDSSGTDDLHTPSLTGSGGSTSVTTPGLEGEARRRTRKSQQQHHTPPHGRQAYVPVSPRCAHCQMPWLPSDLDTPLSYLEVSIQEKGSAGESPLTEYGEKGYFAYGADGAARAIGIGRPGARQQQGEREVVALPTLLRDGGERPRQLSLAEMLSDTAGEGGERGEKR